MALIDDLKTLCDRLDHLGWRDLLLQASGGALDIRQSTPAALKDELTKKFTTTNRTLSGFEDFATMGQQGITAGQPSQSLLYHALASPLIVRDHQSRLLGGFPTPAELETVENFIFSLAPVTLSSFITANGGKNKVAFVVFSSEYRPAADTVDGHHADLVFSRTGVARVGTARPKYLPESRGFWPEDEDNPTAMRVVPAKFSLWLAVKKKGSASRVSPILDNHMGQKVNEPNSDFWIPVHKIFSGSECLTGSTLAVSFSRRLLNIKIQRIHEFIGTSPLPTGFPYVLEDGEIASFATEPDLGPGWLVPTVHPSLVAPAILNGQPITYPVTPANIDGFATFSPGSDSGFPEYVHARTRVLNGVFEDLNSHVNVIAEMTQAPYSALHYLDFTGEGWVEASLGTEAATTLSILSAYTLVSAPDFFPASGQFELSEWSRSSAVPAAFKDKIWSFIENGENSFSLTPTPLSEIRLPANLRLPSSPFKKNDRTMTAMVAMGPPSGVANPWPVQADSLRVSGLPDDAAGIFAPGWDVSTDKTADGTRHLAAYALGSPFPEDAKLCAALSTFWPAAAPDIFRTFVNFPGNKNGTVAPLTDAEIGQSGTLPWDGIPGPKIVNSGGVDFVEYPAFLNADYVQQSLQNRFSIRMTARLTADEYQRRILASCRIYNVLAGLGDLTIARNQWLMLSFVQVSLGDSSLQQAQQDAGHILRGGVFAIKMSRLNDQIVRINAKTERMAILDPIEFYASAEDVLVLVKPDGSPRFSRTRSEP